MKQKTKVIRVRKDSLARLKKIQKWGSYDACLNETMDRIENKQNEVKSGNQNAE